MSLAEIKKLENLDEAYEALLPIVQKNEIVGYEKTTEYTRLAYIFNCISIERNRPISWRRTFNETIEMVTNLSEYKNIALV